MKPQLLQRCVLTSTGFIITALAQYALGQGSLTPPGAPAPMMKTLQQVEPRTPIATLPFAIVAPGSYYLTTNLISPGGIHGITVTADHVTIDLRGFAIIGTGQFVMNWNAINVPAPQVDLKVLNGAITSWSGEGVSAPTTRNSKLDDLRVSTIGRSALHIGDGSLVNNCVVQSNCFYQVGTPAIWVGNHCTVETCVAQNNAGWGISTSSGALVTGCVANNNSDGINTGDDSRVNNCTASLNNGMAPGGPGGDGIFIGNGGTVGDCVASGNAHDGIETIVHAMVLACTVWTNGNDGIIVQRGSTVKDCTAGRNRRDGIGVTENCLAVGNNCVGNGNAGIKAYTDGNRIDSNSVMTNTVAGIDCVVSTADLVIRNSAHANGTDYSLNGAPWPAGTKNATIFTFPPGPPPPGFLNNDPWGNFSY